MNNFDHAVKATETSMNSAGSAAQENARYMEGLEAKTNQLKSTFQDLANNVIDDQLVGALLDLANGFLQLANSPIGTVVTQFTLLAGLGWGATSLLKATKIIPAAVTSFTTFFSIMKSGLTATATGLGATATAAGALQVALGAALPIILAVSAAIVAIVAVVKAVNKAIENNKLENLINKMQSVDEQIDETADKLKMAKERLEELNNTPVEERGEKWQAERDELELLIQDYKDLARILEQQRKEAAQKIVQKKKSTGYKIQLPAGVEATDISTDPEVIAALNKEYESYEAAVLAVAKALQLEGDTTKSLEDRVKDYVAQIAAAQFVIRENIVSAEDYNKQQYEVGSGLVELTVQSENLTNAQKDQIETWLDNNAAIVEAIKINGIQNESEGNLVRVYDRLTGVVEKYTNGQKDANEVTSATTALVRKQLQAQEELKSKLDSVQSALDDYKTSGQMTTSVLDTLEGVIPGITDMLYDEAGALTDVGNEALTSAKKLLMFAIAQETALAGEAGGSEGLGGPSKKPFMEVNLGGTSGGGGLSSKTSQLWDLWEMIATGKWEPSTTTGKTGGGGDTEPEWLKNAKEAFAKLEHQYAMGEISAEKYYDELERLNDKYYKDPAGYQDTYWSYQEKIHSGREQLEKDALKKWEDFVQAQFDTLDRRLAMGEISEEEYYAELKRLNEKYYKDKADYQSQYWSNEEKYHNWHEQNLAEEAEKIKEQQRQVLQNQVDSLNAQKDNLDKIADAAQKQISDKLEELNKIVDEINAKYDAELEALEAQNDALDDQINKEKLLQNLAKAQATMKYVFKDGRFQYVSDVDAVSDAKSDLAEFEREQALKKAKEEIEERRQLALKDVQDEINHWQQLSDIWSNYTTDYENSINMQLYLQKYGVEMEGLTFEQRLAQARQFVNEYNATMASLSNAQASLDSFDSSYTPGQSTEAQLKALQDEYWAARERNDAAGMESANRRANIIRGLGDVVTANVAIEAAKKRAISGEAGLKRPYASGTMSATPGLHLVGENGPELRVLNQGDGILSASMTRNLYKMATAPQLFMQRAAGGGNTNISVANITLPNVRNAQDFLDGLRNMAYQRAYARA